MSGVCAAETWGRRWNTKQGAQRHSITGMASSRRAATKLLWLGADGELLRNASRLWLPAYYIHIIAYTAYKYIACIVYVGYNVHLYYI